MAHPVSLAVAACMPQIPALEAAEALFDTHLRLDEAIDQTLTEVIADTEHSALAIIGQVRHLYDSATKVITYLDGSSLTAGDLGKEIVQSMNYLVEISAFIEHLPAKMQRDSHSVRTIVKEIKELGGLTEAVQAISMQSHLLAINASIEASHAGSAGAAFRVVADEMRKLATDSNAVALRINQGLARARAVVEDGMAASIAESSQQLAAASNSAVSIQKLGHNLEDMSQYYKTRFAIVTKHNEDLARDIGEVLGQIQSQDVVRQSIDRIRFAIGQRNALLESALTMQDEDGAALEALPQQFELILNDYLNENEKHRHSADAGAAGSGDLKIELF